MYNRILNSKVIPVIRTATEQDAINMIGACVDGGCDTVELTYSVPNVCEVIKEATKLFPDTLIGIGSVLNVEQAEAAIEAGADFVVSPGTVNSVIDYCNERGVIYMPGCMTISEMIHVMEKGCKIIKLFPGNCFGSTYISSIKAPMPDVTIMVTGGVDLTNIAEWKAAGTDLIGIGSALNKEIKGDDYSGVTELIKKYMVIA